MDKILGEVDRHYKGTVDIRSLDVDDESNGDYLAAVPVMNVPTLLFYSKGQLVAFTTGMQSRESIIDSIDKELDA